MATTFLEVVDSQGRRRQFELNRPRLLIGREPTCDIHLPHPGVSRRHAQLQRTDQGRWLLQDLSSRNHVFLDNRPIQQTVLEARKPFRIAEYWLSLQEAPSGVQPATEPTPEDLPDTADSVLNQDAAWLDQLMGFERALAALDDPHALLERLVKEFFRVLRPQMVAVGLSRLDGYVWEIVEGDAPKPALADLGEAEAKVAEDHSSFHCWTAGGSKFNGDTPTPAPPLCLLVPMKGRSGLIGHVYVARPAFMPVSKTVQRYLSLAAHYTGMMWDNLQLFHHRQNQIEFEKELHHARQIQIDLFPQDFEVDPRLDAFAVNLPSAKVSGDYYDLIRTGPHTIAFVIADAMGHGMPAALLMAAVRAALRMGLTLDLPWPAIFQGLDDLISQARADTFVTGLVGLLDLRKQELAVVSAGHPLPSILVDARPIPLPEPCITRPWGLGIENPWEVGMIPLHGKQWSILCYTDGVTDAAARAQRRFGAQKVAAFHQKNFHLAAEDLCQLLLNEVAVQPGTTSLGDDQTVLVLCSAKGPGQV